MSGRRMSQVSAALIVVVCLAGVLVGVVPGYRIYRHSLADGLTIRV